MVLKFKIMDLRCLSLLKLQSKLFRKSVLFRKQLSTSCSCKLKANVSTTAINPITISRTNTDLYSFTNSKKVTIMSSLNFKCNEDAAPFWKLPISILIQIQRTTIDDVRCRYCENRLYYISSHIQCPPANVSEKLAKRTFIYTLPFQWMENSLNELLDKDVPGDRILRDLWVLKYHHKTIRERLENIKNKGIANLYPWMVRCSPQILNRYLKITQETKSILGDTKSTLVYLANRLNISVEEVEEMCVKVPALKTIRATKVKHFLDFLIDEGFDIEEIVNKPRILASSQKTAKHRLEQLRQLGVMDINLNLLCRSKKDYKKICETLGAGLKDGIVLESGSK